MKIIALQGKPNCGKTTVIAKLNQKLCSTYKRKLYKPNNQDGDFTAVFDVKSHIIGIVSAGDYERDLIEPVEIVENNGCELCVVCCHKKHTKGDSKIFLKKRLNKITLISYGCQRHIYNRAMLYIMQALKLTK